MLNSDWTELGRFSSRAEAEIVRALLESHGIPAVVSGDDAGGAYPHLGPIHGVRVLVARGDLANARRRLREAGDARDENDPAE